MYVCILVEDIKVYLNNINLREYGTIRNCYANFIKLILSGLRIALRGREVSSHCSYVGPFRNPNYLLLNGIFHKRRPNKLGMNFKNIKRVKLSLLMMVRLFCRKHPFQKTFWALNELGCFFLSKTMNGLILSSALLGCNSSFNSNK